ncbi:MAG: hypothetical protein HWN65_11230 [Candidatus Helarchaeota archaeon]|nr:hypothetical protein [Candidatus Helarchaeota archaeon]
MLSTVTGSAKPYDYDYTKPFKKQFKKLRDQAVQTQIENYIDEYLVADPYKYSNRLKDPNYKGLRRSIIKDYRVSFVICEECRKELWQEIFGCPDCKQILNKFLRFVEVGHRGKYYKFRLK